MEKVAAYLRLMRVDRPIGAFLLAWPTLWALWIAGGGQPKANIVLIFMLGVFVMRAAGCVINDFADRNFDGHVARTIDRPLATGEISPREALFLFISLIGIALLLVIQLNDLSMWLAVIAAGLATLYPFTKRFTHLPQFVLGLAFSMSIPMAFAAHLAQVPTIAWWLFTANMLWVVAYDTIYAMIDKEDDLKIGIKSTAILFGRHVKLIIFLLSLGAVSLLAIIGLHNGFKAYYFGGLGLAFANVLYQQFLLKGDDPAKFFQAFLSNNWFGASIFAGLVLNYLPLS